MLATLAVLSVQSAMANGKADFKNATPIVLGEKTEAVKKEGLTPHKVKSLQKLGKAIFDGTKATKQTSTSSLEYKSNNQELTTTTTVEPKEPVAPTDPEEKTTEKPAASESNSKATGDSPKKDDNFKIQVMVYFGNGKHIAGWIYGVKKRKLEIKHTLHGNHFTKTIDLADVTSLNILSYEKKRLRNVRGGTMFEFIPNKIRITKRDGTTLTYSSLPTFLKGFRFYSDNLGHAKLFTYFADVKNKAGDWRNRSNGKDAHPNVVTKFVFTK